MEGNLLGLHFAVLNFDLIARQHNGNVFAHARQVAVPVGNVFVPSKIAVQLNLKS